MGDPTLRKRIIPSRACYRDKAKATGGKARAKCRIVAVGCLDPAFDAFLGRRLLLPGHQRCRDQAQVVSLVRRPDSILTGPTRPNPSTAALYTYVHHEIPSYAQLRSSRRTSTWRREMVCPQVRRHAVLPPIDLKPEHAYGCRPGLRRRFCRRLQR